jgi:regulatory protein
MVITSIEQQKKNQKRWNIYVDGEFCCGVAEDTLLKFGLRKKDELDGKLLDKIKDFDEFVYAKKTAYDFLSYRNRSISEITKKLKSKDISTDTAQRVIKHIKELGLLNDEQFAKQLISEKLKRKPVGKKVLMQKLYQKGIDKNISTGVLEQEFTPEKEREFALENFKKLLPKIKEQDKNMQRKKTYELLARRGFNYDIITEIIHQYLK